MGSAQLKIDFKKFLINFEAQMVLKANELLHAKAQI